jgi:peptidoglycan hydrolase-like protein with peptidoglycan-binding domain
LGFHFLIEVMLKSAMVGRKQFRRGALIALCALGSICVSATAQSSTTGTPKKPTTHSTKNSHKKKSTKVRGQQKIDSDRAQQIQAALIREHYLSGEPTGTWDSSSEEAMRRFQADNGWQNKSVPDSRALIKLGLGPSKDHLLNPDSAMTTVPDAPTAASTLPTSSTTPSVANPGAPSTNSARPQ